MDPATQHLILFAAGCVAGVLNVIAGGGSFLTLPLLIFLGLPAVEANGTNRVGIFLQNIGAVWGFHRYGVLESRFFLQAAVPGVLGSLLGTWLALIVGDDAFKRILAILMAAVTFWTLWDPLTRQDASRVDFDRWRDLAFAGGFFLVGVYAGFVQAGVGFFILAVTTLAGLDLV
ncbi:MAG: sulfite exporter TauE/SafE family protein, partial [Nitrospirales bacterium]